MLHAVGIEYAHLHTPLAGHLLQLARIEQQLEHMLGLITLAAAEHRVQPLAHVQIYLTGLIIDYPVRPTLKRIHAVQTSLDIYGQVITHLQLVQKRHLHAVDCQRRLRGHIGIVAYHRLHLLLQSVGHHLHRLAKRRVQFRAILHAVILAVYGLYHLPAQRVLVIEYAHVIVAVMLLRIGDVRGIVPQLALVFRSEIQVHHHVVEYVALRDGVNAAVRIGFVADVLHVSVIELQGALDIRIQCRGREIALVAFVVGPELVEQGADLGSFLHRRHRRAVDAGTVAELHGDTLQGLAAIYLLELHQIARLAAAAHSVALTGIIYQMHPAGARQQPVKPIVVQFLLMVGGRKAVTIAQRVGNEAALACVARHYLIVHRKDDDTVEIQRARLQQTHHLQSLQRLALERDLLAAHHLLKDMEQCARTHLDAVHLAGRGYLEQGCQIHLYQHPLHLVLIVGLSLRQPEVHGAQQLLQPCHAFLQPGCGAERIEQPA